MKKSETQQAGKTYRESVDAVNTNKIQGKKFSEQCKYMYVKCRRQSLLCFCEPKQHVLLQKHVVTSTKTCSYFYKNMQILVPKHVVTSAKTCSYFYKNMQLLLQKHVVTSTKTYSYFYQNMQLLNQNIQLLLPKHVVTSTKTCSYFYQNMQLLLPKHVVTSTKTCSYFYKNSSYFYQNSSYFCKSAQIMLAFITSVAPLAPNHTTTFTLSVTRHRIFMWKKAQSCCLSHGQCAIGKLQQLSGFCRNQRKWLLLIVNMSFSANARKRHAWYNRNIMSTQE